MKVQTMSAIALVGIAGSAMAADALVRLEPTAGNVRHVGNIYFNVASGERITTVIDAGDAQRPVDGEVGNEIWVIGGSQPCDGMGGTSSGFFAVDYIEVTSEHDTLSPMLLDWGDIESDTVVDCVQIHWVTNHDDVDLNSDGFADGVEGFGATWTFWDGMNGRSPQMESIALPIIDLTFHSLPGDLSDSNDSFVSFYTADIDLGASAGSSLVFEIGDTDSDLQAAVVHNARMDLNDADGDGVSDIDPDEDGLADWGWSIDFHQPGTVDFDNADGDSNPLTGRDGDPDAFAVAGLIFGMPSPGHSEFDPNTGEWDWVSDGPTAGATEDLFTLVFDGVNVGPFDFGGFSCDPYVPWADFAIVLYGPGDASVCSADLNQDGELDFLDISIFVSDLPDYNGDTEFDFLDITAFVNDFGAGCVF